MTRTPSAVNDQFVVDHLEAGRPVAPAWLRALFAEADGPHRVQSACASPVQLDWQQQGNLVLLQARVRNAVAFDGVQLEEAACTAYTRISQWMDALDADRPARHAWRFWNFVPDIVRQLPDGRDRYMAFNAGRHRAFETWHGRAFQSQLVAASAVDHLGADLLVQMVAGPESAVAIENPRQRSAYRYSQRFGPVPPSFARAVLVHVTPTGGPQLFVAGTASIVGEASLHVGDVQAQTRETLHNLAALLEQVAQQQGGLAMAYQQLRIYLVEPGDEEAVLSIVARALPTVSLVEVMPARLCRSELLVEIDALATPTDGATR